MPEYIPTPTGRLFHEDKTSHIKGIVGPVGSGKSSASVIELVIRATEQKPGPDGVRRSRWAIIRNSFPQLKSTTIQTFQQWLPQSVCPIKYGSPITATFKRDLPDGTKVEAQFWFFPMDDERSMANLLSLELTGAWINEASEIAEFVPDAVFMRVGRYPAKADGEYTWSGIIFDSNPSSVKHWMYKRFVLDPAPGTVLFRQPPALTPIYDPEHPNDLARAQFEPNPEAENIENLGKGYDYYMDIVATHRHDPEYIKRFVLGEFTMGLSGHPVYPMFREHEHVSAENRLRADRSHMLLMGMDFGLCYDDETEVLTDSGWKFFRELDKERDKILARDPKTGVAAYEPINFIVDEPHDGEWLEWESQTLSMCVTPEHRVPLRSSDTGQVTFRTARWLAEHRGTHATLDKTARVFGETPETIMGYDAEWFAWFMGIFMSDGSVERASENSYRITIAQTKQEHRAVISRWLKGKGWAESKQGFHKTDNVLGKYLYGLGSRKADRRIPPEVMRLDGPLLQLFIEAFALGDGHVRPGHTGGAEITIYTAHKHIADQLQEMAVLAGGSAAVRVQRGQTSVFADGREVVSGDGYRLSFNSRIQSVAPRNARFRVVRKKSRRYCVNVKHHVICVRRHGITHWNGNSPAVAFGQFKDGRLEIYDELFEEDCSLIEFIEDHLAPFVRSEYPGFRHIIVGDPSATVRSGIDKARPLQVLAQHGFTVMPATTNSLQARLDAVRWFLRRREAFKVNKRCEMLVGGFLGGYQWKEKKTALGGRQVVMVPNKDGEPGRYSHIHDACQYLANYVQNGGETIVTGRNTLFEDDLGGYRVRKISLLDPYGVDSSKPKSKRFLYV